MHPSEDGADRGLRTRESALALPEPLRAAELAYLDLRDEYLAGAGLRVAAEAARERAFRSRDEEGLREATRRLGALGAMPGEARETARRTGEHAYGLAFRVAMRRLLSWDVADAIDAECLALAGAPATALPDTTQVDGQPTVSLEHRTMAAWREAMDAERAALEAEMSRMDAASRTEAEGRLRAIDAFVGQWQARSANASMETPEILVAAVAARMLDRNALAALRAEAETILGRPMTEMRAQKGKGRSNREDRPVDLRHLAFLEDEAGRRHRGRRPRQEAGGAESGEPVSPRP